MRRWVERLVFGFSWADLASALEGARVEAEEA